GFMLGNFRDKLQQVGRLELLEDAATKAIALFDRRGDELGANERLLSALARRVLGDVIMARGQAADAIARQREALAINERLAAEQPFSDDAQLGLAVSLDYLASAL